MNLFLQPVIIAHDKDGQPHEQITRYWLSSYDKAILIFILACRLILITVSHTCSLFEYDIDGLAQDCSNSIANVLDLLQSCTEPSIYH